MFNSPHVQTLWAPFFRAKPKIDRVAEKFQFSDGDHCWLYWAGRALITPRSNVVVLMHGLSGSADSLYMLCMQRHLLSLGLPSVAINYRGAGGKPNNKARNYHAGETQDLHEVFSQWQRQRPDQHFFALGFSLGGSRLLNFLSEGHQPQILGAVAVCVPLDLAVCENRINQGFSKVYRYHLLKGLVADMTGKLSHLESVAPVEAGKLKRLGDLNRLKTFREYDSRVICALYDFEDANDYYRRCSALPKLKNITNSVVLIQAPDDPLMTENTLPTRDQLGAGVRLLTRKGGHVGFVDGLPFDPCYWLEHSIGGLLDSFTEKCEPVQINE